MGGGKERHKSLIVPDFEKCGKYEDFEDEIRRVARETAEMSLRLLGSGKIWQNPEIFNMLFAICLQFPECTLKKTFFFSDAE